MSDKHFYVDVLVKFWSTRDRCFGYEWRPMRQSNGAPYFFSEDEARSWKVSYVQQSGKPGTYRVRNVVTGEIAA